jgi:hypothetical protein
MQGRSALALPCTSTGARDACTAGCCMPMRTLRTVGRFAVTATPCCRKAAPPQTTWVYSAPAALQHDIHVDLMPPIAPCPPHPSPWMPSHQPGAPQHPATILQPQCDCTFVQAELNWSTPPPPAQPAPPTPFSSACLALIYLRFSIKPCPKCIGSSAHVRSRVISRQPGLQLDSPADYGPTLWW